MRNVHDNFVYSYAVLCEDRRIILFTHFRDNGADEFTDATFDGVLVHFFQTSLSGNILFGIYEVSAESVVRDDADLFARQKDFWWPEIKYTNLDDLIRILNERGIRGYEIHSSLGLSGWVLAKSMTLIERQKAWNPNESN